jgi:hypothetical protein
MKKTATSQFKPDTRFRGDRGGGGDQRGRSSGVLFPAPDSGGRAVDLGENRETGKERSSSGVPPAVRADTGHAGECGAGPFFTDGSVLDAVRVTHALAFGSLQAMQATASGSLTVSQMPHVQPGPASTTSMRCSGSAVPANRLPAGSSDVGAALRTTWQARHLSSRAALTVSQTLHCQVAILGLVNSPEARQHAVHAEREHPDHVCRKLRCL